MKKEFKGPGKGKGPIVGYNPKNWYANYGDINWHNKWCPVCGEWTDHTSGACPQLAKKLKRIDTLNKRNKHGTTTTKTKHI